MSGNAVRFTEEMRGFIGFGEPGYGAGAAVGQASDTRVVLQLTIRIADLAQLADDPSHVASVTGYVGCEALGGELAIESGSFSLFPAGAAPLLMRYRLQFRDGVGHPLTLSGVKIGDGTTPLALLRGTTTLYTRVVRGYVGAQQEPAAELVAAGILRFGPLDLGRQVVSFRGPRVTSIAAFWGWFFQELGAYAWTTHAHEHAPTTASVGIHTRRSVAGGAAHAEAADDR